MLEITISQKITYIFKDFSRIFQNRVKYPLANQDNYIKPQQWFWCNISLSLCKEHFTKIIDQLRKNQ